MPVSSLSPSFLDTCSMSVPYMGFKALWTVISFLVLWFSYLNSSLVHFKNGPEYLTRRTAQIFIPLIRFLQYDFVSSNFLVLLRYFLKKFYSISTYLMFSASNIFMYYDVSFSLSVLILSWFDSSILLVMCCCPLLIVHFSMPNSIHMSRLYNLTACMRVSNFSSLSANG